MELESSEYRAMEGSIELEFSNEEGDITASPEEQKEFLIKNGFNEEAVELFIKMILEDL